MNRREKTVKEKGETCKDKEETRKTDKEKKSVWCWKAGESKTSHCGRCSRRSWWCWSLWLHKSWKHTFTDTHQLTAHLLLLLSHATEHFILLFAISHSANHWHQEHQELLALEMPSMCIVNKAREIDLIIYTTPRPAEQYHLSWGTVGTAMKNSLFC